MAGRLPFAAVEATLYRHLFPQGPDVDALSYVRSLELRKANADRPYVLANFVASLDGHATVGKDSRKLSGHADRELFYALRERVDAVLIGTRTLKAEHYKRMLPQAERRERRLDAGLRAEPLAVTVTRSGQVPRDIPLFEQEGVLVFKGVTLRETLASLRHDHQVQTLLCEGGPTLFRALLQEQLVDELFLTLAPALTGGAPGPAVVSGPPPETPTQLQLETALEHDGTLFLRYKI